MIDHESNNDYSWREAINDLHDLHRGIPRDGDNKQVAAARRYLGARFTRISVEMDTMGDQFIALPYRISEIFKARKLTGVLGLTFDSRVERDMQLPDIAREIVS